MAASVPSGIRTVSKAAAAPKRSFICMGVLSLFNAVLRTTSQSASQPRPGCGTQHPQRFACVLLAAAPTATPCFRHWRRSSLLPLLGEPLASRETLSWTLEAQYGAKWRASLQRAAASEHAPCQAAVNLGSGARLLPINRALFVQRGPGRYAKGSPIRGAGKADRL